MADVEKTYVMVKPDGVQRGLVGRIIQRFEDKGFRLIGLKMRLAPEDLLRNHYSELQEKPFFSTLMAYVGSGPVVCMCLLARDAPEMARSLIGATDPMQASTGTIRGDYGLVSGRNVVHGADSKDSAEREIALWFNDDEIIEWEPAMQGWLYDD